MRLWIDDERVTPAEYSHAAQSSTQAINILAAERSAGRHVELVSFDHDLGYCWEDGHSKIDGGIRDDTSRPVMLWMIENDYWPQEIRFHTANPVGRQWLVGMAQRYAPEWVRLNA